MRTVSIELHEILDFVSAEMVYNSPNQDVLCFFAMQTKSLSNEEIEEFSQWFLSPQMKEHGYTEENYRHVKESLTEWRDRYIIGIGSDM